MALSIQAGTESEILGGWGGGWGGGCGFGAEEEEVEEEDEEEGKAGLGMEAWLGARGVLGVVGIFEIGVLMAGEFTRDVSEGTGC